MSRLLLVSYLFPPLGGVGVQRALSLAKYLPQNGFEVHVLQARNAAGPVSDPALLQQIPPGVRIHQAFTPELPFHFRQALWRIFGGKSKPANATPAAKSRSFRLTRIPVEIGRRVLCPEPEITWVPFALRRARRIVREFGIDSVVVTAPPFSAFLVGVALKREFPHLRLVADFRDDWLSFYLGEFEYQNSDYTRKRAMQIDRETIQAADRVVVVTQAMLDRFRERYPDQKSEKFVLIPNGFDPAVLPEPAVRANHRPKVVVSHIGTVYSASSPRYYLDALESLPEHIRDGIETRFVGRIAEEEKPFLSNRKAQVTSVGFLPQKEALNEMVQADYLLLTMTDSASLTGKVFEYLATGKPILAIADENGEVARILRETGAGWCASPNKPDEIRTLLKRAYERIRAGGANFCPNWNVIRRFERPRLVAEFGLLVKNA